MAAKKKDDEEFRVLEVNLISAQDLRAPATPRRNFQTYAVVWVDDPTRKLRTKTDTSGAANPTWNDKFLFRLSPEYLSSPTAGINVEIYAVRSFKDSLVGTSRCLINNCIGKFASVYVHRPSGNFHGILNIAAGVNFEAPDPMISSIFKGAGSVNFNDLTMAATPPRKSSAEASQKKGLSGMLRMVKSSPALVALASLSPRRSFNSSTPQRRSFSSMPEIETLSLRPVQSDPAISMRLSAAGWNGTSFSSDCDSES